MKKLLIVLLGISFVTSACSRRDEMESKQATLVEQAQANKTAQEIFLDFNSIENLAITQNDVLSCLNNVGLRDNYFLQSEKKHDKGLKTQVAVIFKPNGEETDQVVRKLAFVWGKEKDANLSALLLYANTKAIDLDNDGLTQKIMSCALIPSLRPEDNNALLMELIDGVKKQNNFVKEIGSNSINLKSGSDRSHILFSTGKKETLKIVLANEQKIWNLALGNQAFVNEDDGLNNQVNMLYQKLKEVRIKAEVALFEGKRPVVTNTEADQANGGAEWVGLLYSEYSADFLIHQEPNKENPQQWGQWDIVSTIGNKASPQLFGTQLVFTREAGDGDWSCYFYYGDNKELSNISLKNCQLIPEKYVTGKIPPSLEKIGNSICDISLCKSRLNLVQPPLRFTKEEHTGYTVEVDRDKQIMLYREKGNHNVYKVEFRFLASEVMNRGTRSGVIGATSFSYDILSIFIKETAAQDQFIKYLLKWMKTPSMLKDETHQYGKIKLTFSTKQDKSATAEQDSVWVTLEAVGNATLPECPIFKNGVKMSGWPQFGIIKDEYFEGFCQHQYRINFDITSHPQVKRECLAAIFQELQTAQAMSKYTSLTLAKWAKELKEAEKDGRKGIAYESEKLSLRSKRYLNRVQDIKVQISQLQSDKEKVLGMSCRFCASQKLLKAREK